MKKKEIIIYHLLFWFLILNYSLFLVIPKHNSDSSAEFANLIVDTLISMSLITILFYTAYFTYPYFIRQPIRFILIAGLFLIGFILFLYSAFQVNRIHVFMKVMIAFCQALLLISWVAFGVLGRLLIQGIKDGRLRKQLEKEKLTTQLELLKSQLNPHFLFNSLNNVDILIREDPERASLFLNKLSDILRYSLYETKQEKVPVEMEIENMQKYIELQKLRTNNPSFVKLTVEGDLNGVTVAPMIFLPFLENAFKHSTNKKIDNAIVVTINVNQTRIRFDCRNHCGEVFQPEGTSSGMGMTLIRSRLDLLFQDRYRLKSEKTEDWYEVNLIIPPDDH